jgi:hypothetical protein
MQHLRKGDLCAYGDQCKKKNGQPCNFQHFDSLPPAPPAAAPVAAAAKPTSPPQAPSAASPQPVADVQTLLQQFVLQSQQQMEQFFAALRSSTAGVGGAAGTAGAP